MIQTDKLKDSISGKEILTEDIVDGSLVGKELKLENGVLTKADGSELRIKVKDAVNDDEAVSLGQILNKVSMLNVSTGSVSAGNIGTFLDTDITIQKKGSILLIFNGDVQNYGGNDTGFGVYLFVNGNKVNYDKFYSFDRWQGNVSSGTIRLKWTTIGLSPIFNINDTVNIKVKLESGNLGGSNYFVYSPKLFVFQGV